MKLYEVKTRIGIINIHAVLYINLLVNKFTSVQKNIKGKKSYLLELQIL